MDDKVLLAEKLTKGILESGLLEEVVVDVLEDNLRINFAELSRLSEKEYLGAGEHQDYISCLEFVRACITILDYFTINDYTEQQVEANRYSLKLEEWF